MSRPRQDVQAERQHPAAVCGRGGRHRAVRRVHPEERAAVQDEERYESLTASSH